MSLNLLKTVELVFRRPNVSGDRLPPALPDTNRLCDAKLLGVYFRHDFLQRAAMLALQALY